MLHSKGHREFSWAGGVTWCREHKGWRQKHSGSGTSCCSNFNVFPKAYMWEFDPHQSHVGGGVSGGGVAVVGYWDTWMDQPHYPWQEWVPNNKMVPIDSSRTCSLPRDALCHATMSKKSLRWCWYVGHFCFLQLQGNKFLLFVNDSVSGVLP